MEFLDSTEYQSNQSSWFLANLDETIQFGEELYDFIQPARLLFLEGELGVGKTSLVKGIAKKLEIYEPITSPSFPLSQHYVNGTRTLIHLDLYRFENELSANQLFLEEEEAASEMDAFMVVEWPRRMSLLIQDAWYAKMEYWDNKKRLIQLSAPFNEDKNLSTSSSTG